MPRSLVFAALVVGLSAPSAQAATVVFFKDANQFKAGLEAPAVLEDFADTVFADGLSISGAGVGFNNGKLRHGINPATTPTVTFDFADPISAFGGIFDFTPGGVGNRFDLVVHFADIRLGSLNLGYPSVSNGFYGFRSDTAISKVVFTARSAGLESYTFDNLQFAGVSAVPEPATWAMMIAGFGLAGLTLRARRRTFQPA